MTDDKGVLTLLRTQADDSAPALTLQAVDLIQAGRRRRLGHRLLGAGAGLAVVAAIGVATFAFTGSDPSTSPEPTDKATTEAVPEYVAHAMPAILKDAALTPFDRLPDWTSFRIDAYGAGGQDTSLSQSRWDEAGTWQLTGVTDTGAIQVSVFYQSGSDPFDPDTYCDRARDDGYLSCDYQTLPDGRLAYQTWPKPVVNARTVFRGSTADPLPGKPWFVHEVLVLDPSTGFAVTVREGVPAASIDAATRNLWLPPAELLEMARNPILDLDGALPR